MSDLSYFGVRVAMDELTRPWHAFCGLVDLRPSTHCTKGDMYAVDSSRSGFSDLGCCVVLHPDDVERMRAAARSHAGRSTISDAELAAFLYWHAHRKGTKNT